MDINLDEKFWSQDGEGGTAPTGPLNIIGRKELFDAVIDLLAGSGFAGQLFNRDAAKSFATNKDWNNITQMSFALNKSAITVDASNAAKAANDTAGGVLFVGDSGNDQLTGGDGQDVLLGGNEENSKGNGDLLDGGKGKDILVGGAGYDVLRGGAGSDYLNGGTGIDIADYSIPSRWFAHFYIGRKH